MPNTYRATTDHGVAMYGDDVFEKDWSPSEEKDWLDSGHVELVPRDYTILSDNFSGGPSGTPYRAAMLKEVEEALIAGGHIERADHLQDVVAEPGGDTEFAGQVADGGEAPPEPEAEPEE